MPFGSMLGQKECVAAMLVHPYMSEKSGAQKSAMLRLAPLFIRIFGYPHLGLRARAPHVMNALSPKRGEKILDAGCGTGVLSLEIAKKGAEAHGIDTDADDIWLAEAFAKITGASASFSAGDVSGLKFKAGFFDKAVCSEVIEHIKDDSAAIRSLCRVIKKNGVLVLTTPKEVSGFLKYGNAAGHKRAGYTKDGLKKLLEENGFKARSIDEIYRYGSVLGERLSGAFPAFFIFPLAYLLSRLDFLFRKGNCLIAVAVKK